MSMNYFDTYKDDLKLSGYSHENEIINRSKKLAKDNIIFSDVIEIDNVETIAAIKHTKDHNFKKAILPSDYICNIGSVIKSNEKLYLAMDFLNEGVYQIFPTSTLRLCNNTYTIKTDPTQTPKTDANGKIITDKYGRPIMIVVDGTTIDVPCIAETKYQSINENDQLPLPDGRLNVTMQYNPSRQIKINDTFKMYNKTYRVSDYDLTNVMNGIGYVIYHCDRIPDEVA